MALHLEQRELELPARARGFHDVTGALRACVSEWGLERGLLNVFLKHTSASLVINENADPQVLRDLEAFAQRLVPDGDALFDHTAEGPDDMPAHVRTALTATSLQLPIAGGRLALGTWQAVYLWEHSTAPHTRRLLLSAVGELPTHA
ncbi:MAG: secondary thiamine-phosphate synthase enzyme YjbQ [Planctomycetota bacterium]|jgi:secondary thiamine-phosphate synthase enzyme